MAVEAEISCALRSTATTRYCAKLFKSSVGSVGGESGRSDPVMLGRQDTSQALSS